MTAHNRTRACRRPADGAKSVRKVLPAVIGVIGLATKSPVRAGPVIYSPIVTRGELELEARAMRVSDSRPDFRGAGRGMLDIGYAPLDWWKSEFEFQWKRDAGDRTKFDSVALENFFQLTPQGRYWLDVGLFVEYERVAQPGDHDSFTFGPMLQKEFGPFLAVADLLLSREIGRGASSHFDVDYRLQIQWQVLPRFAAAVEVYGKPGAISGFDDVRDQMLMAGPVGLGSMSFGAAGKLKYAVGYLFGLTRATERGTMKAVLEYEHAF